jgi:CRISPR/Cas system endoribonuclease Cas6 (RAMP superfamily)
MSFGGLLGETVYTGELSPFVPWLALGQWVGVGGKTSFGLGLYQLEIMNENT